MEKITRGMVVATLNGQRRTNGIVTQVAMPRITVLTDFGNKIELSVEEFHHSYEVSTNWLNAIEMGYPLESVTERIQQQILLLQGHLETELNQSF